MQIHIGQNSSYQIAERADAIAITLDEGTTTAPATWQLDVYVQSDEGKSYLGTLNTVAAANSPRLARVIGYAVCPGARAWMIEPFGTSHVAEGPVFIDVPTLAHLRAQSVDPAAFGLSPGIYRPLGRTIFNGNIGTATGGDSTAPLASSRTDFTTPIAFAGAFGSNETGATIWIMFFDALATPANGTQPVHGLSFNVGAGATFNWIAPAPGVFLGTGLTWVASSTPDTLTAIAAGPTARVVTMATW